MHLPTFIWVWKGMFYVGCKNQESYCTWAVQVLGVLKLGPLPLLWVLWEYSGVLAGLNKNANECTHCTQPSHLFREIHIFLRHKTEKGLRAAYTIHTSYSTGLHKYQWTAQITLWKESLAYLVRSWIHKKCLSFWTLLAPAYICYWAIGCGWHILQG